MLYYLEDINLIVYLNEKNVKKIIVELIVEKKHRETTIFQLVPEIENAPVGAPGLF